MGLFQLTMYGVGLILGAGIYVLIGEAVGFAGNSVWISFLLGTIVAIFAGLSYAELCALFPKAAAEYVFIKNAFKNNFFAFIRWDYLRSKSPEYPNIPEVGKYMIMKQVGFLNSKSVGGGGAKRYEPALPYPIKRIYITSVLILLFKG